MKQRSKLKSLTMGSVGGVVASLTAPFSEDLSSIPAEYLPLCLFSRKRRGQ